MIEQDYFMRMISMLASMLARILFLKKQKDFPRALLEVQTACRTLLGIEHSVIRICSPAQLSELLGTDPSLAIHRAYILGLLLKEEADIRRMAGEETEACLLDLKSLELLIDARLGEGKALTPEHESQVDALLSGLAGYPIEPGVLEKIMSYHEETGRFDRAENVLFDILAASPEFAPEGLQFYRRLLMKSDEDLRAGNLPRDEVMEGIAEIKNR
ncbi:MAG TPA: DUF6483 family protein [Bacteroidota bacterium]|nr:DUF6483 family protein [Bacteroidota bacterium]